MRQLRAANDPENGDEIPDVFFATLQLLDPPFCRVAQTDLTDNAQIHFSAVFGPCFSEVVRF